MKVERVFVYGTLMSGLHNHYLVKPYLIKIQAGKTKGVLYDLPYGYPAMIPGNGTVYGEVMELNNVNQAFFVLDGLEDFHGKDSPNNLYNRVVQEVETIGGGRFDAYLYIWGKPDELRELGTIVPEGDWRKYMNSSY